MLDHSQAREMASKGRCSTGLHGNRFFNDLFHDNHVQILKVTDIIGTGTTNAPRGMWTMFAGD